MAYNPPVYDKKLRRRFRRFVAKWLEKNMTPIEAGEEITFDEWIESTDYPEWRRKELREVYDRLMDENTYFANETDRLHKNADVKIFAKEENYPEYKYHRSIWARVDEFKVISGPFFKMIEKQLFKLPYFIKKVPKAERPAYIKNLIEKTGMMYMCTDFTSFESLFTTDMQDDCEFQLYRYMSSKSDAMKRICRMLFAVLAGDNVCKNKYFHVSVDAKRMSGEMCTSLGNGFSNLMFILFALEEHKIGHSGVVVEGDDGLTGLEKEIPQEFFVKMGLNVKMELKNNVSEASFCGIIYDDESLINITEPLKHLCFSTWVSKKYVYVSDAKYFGLIKSKMLSIAYEYPGCPILDKYARKMLELLDGYRVTFDNTDLYNLKTVQTYAKRYAYSDIPTRSTSLSTRELMERYYNISVSEQLAIEKSIEGMTLTYWDHSALMALIPTLWVEHYNRYSRKWTNQIMDSIRRPLIAFGERENLKGLSKTTKFSLRNMDKIMTKKQYFVTNKTKFASLSTKDKNDRYAEYLLKKRDKKSRLAKNQGPINSRQVMRSPKVMKTQQPQQSKVHIADCTLLYARASIDPFVLLPKDPCIPDAICAPSYKFNTSIMGTMTVGPARTGFVAFNPITAAINDNNSNLVAIDFPIISTTGFYAGTDYNPDPAFLPAAGGNQLVGANSNSYFNDAIFQTAEVRLVAAGVEVFYTGSVLNQSGVVTTLQNDGYVPLATGTTVNAIQANPRAVVCPTSKDSRCYISYYPTDSDQFSYKNFESQRPSVAGIPNGYAMIIFVSGAFPGSTFQFKAKCYYEAQIPGLSSTASESDPIGFSALAAARTQTPRTDDPGMDYIETVKQTIRVIGSQLSGIAPTVGRAVGSLVLQPELGGLAGDLTAAAINSLLK